METDLSSAFGLTRTGSQELLASDYGAADILRMSKFKIGEELMVRIIKGPVRKHRVYVPTLRQNQSTGAWMEGGEEFVVADRRNNFFTALATADKQLRIEMFGGNPADVKSTFDARSAYLAIGMPRGYAPGGEVEPYTKVMEIPWKVAGKLAQMLEKTHPGDESMMRYGPLQFFDVVISVFEDPKKAGNSKLQDWQKRDYDVDDFNNQWRGKCPVAWQNGVPTDYDYVEHKVFTPDELNVALEALSADHLTKMTRIHSAEEIRSKLSEVKINLFGTRDGLPIFPHASKLIDFMTTAALPHFSSDEVTERMGELPAGQGVAAPQAPAIPTETTSSDAKGIESQSGTEAAVASEGEVHKY